MATALMVSTNYAELIFKDQYSTIKSAVYPLLLDRPAFVISESCPYLKVVTH